MDSVLASIVTVNKTTAKELSEQTKLLERIAASQDKLAVIEKKRATEEARNKRQDKRKSGDRNILKGMTKKKGDEKEKKGVFDWLKNMLGGLFSGGGLLKLLAGLGIGTAIYQYLNNEKFSNFVNDKVLTPIKNAVMEVGEKAYSQAESNPSDDVIETDFSTEK